MNEQQARVGARWWADCLRNGSKMDNGDKSEIGGMTLAMAMMLQQSRISKITPEQVDVFETALVDTIMAFEDELWDVLNVDYHANAPLRAAGEKAGIDVDFGVLPMKTTMYFQDDGVQLLYGYGAPVQELLKETG